MSDPKEDSVDKFPTLPKEIDDPMEVLNLLKSAILRQSVDKGQVVQALRQVLHNYEMQNRVFLIAAANAELPRILRLLTFINACEGEMMKAERIADASTKELTRLYALAQSNLLSSLDDVKRVADMRIEMMRATTGGKIEGLFDPNAEELNTLAGLPGLDGPSRDRVRKIVGGLLDAIDRDKSVTDNDEDESDDTGDIDTEPYPENEDDPSEDDSED